MPDFTSIRQSTDNLRRVVRSLNCPATEENCDVAFSELDSIESELDNFEPEETDEFTELIPNNLSAGDADELKGLILNWRKEHGYGIPT